MAAVGSLAVVSEAQHLSAVGHDQPRTELFGERGAVSGVHAVHLALGRAPPHLKKVRPVGHRGAKALRVEDPELVYAGHDVALGRVEVVLLGRR